MSLLNVNKTNNIFLSMVALNLIAGCANQSGIKNEYGNEIIKSSVNQSSKKKETDDAKLDGNGPAHYLTYKELEKNKAQILIDASIGSSMQCITTGSYPLHWKFKNTLGLRCENLGIVTGKEMEGWGWYIGNFEEMRTEKFKYFLVDAKKTTTQK